MAHINRLNQDNNPNITYRTHDQTTFEEAENHRKSLAKGSRALQIWEVHKHRPLNLRPNVNNDHDLEQAR